MHCSDAKHHALAFEEGRLAPAEKASFEAHLAGCARCAQIYPHYAASTCVWMLDFVGDYLDGTLPELERETFEWHLAACAGCRAYLATYGATIRSARAAAQLAEPLPRDLVASILAARRR